MKVKNKSENENEVLWGNKPEEENVSDVKNHRTAE